MKYYIVSDIHGYCDYLIRDLLKEGYERENQNHTLIVLGDILDRGTQPKETLDFLMAVPKDNLIMVKGNHEYLLENLLNLPPHFLCLLLYHYFLLIFLFSLVHRYLWFLFPY